MGAGGAEGGADIPGFICTSLGFVSLSAASSGRLWYCMQDSCWDYLTLFIGF